ncbi:MAG: BlaI/MecI/CopY family transcriptional regulator [Pseudomonadota bacterium]
MHEASKLSRRERQIMDVLYRLGEGSVSDVRAAMEDPPAYSSVRTFLTKLLEKGAVLHRPDGNRYIYRPAQAREDAAKQALERLVRNFFGGRGVDAVVGLLGEQSDDLDDADIEAIEAAIAKVKTGAKRVPPRRCRSGGRGRGRGRGH